MIPTFWNGPAVLDGRQGPLSGRPCSCVRGCAAWLMGSGKFEGTHVLFLSISFISSHEAVSPGGGSVDLDHDG
jgi:hypothetical protein